MFTEEFGITPAVFVEKLRIESARRLIEESSRSFDEIAGDCGLGTAGTMRHAFIRVFQQTPERMRQVSQVKQFMSVY